MKLTVILVSLGAVAYFVWNAATYRHDHMEEKSIERFAAVEFRSRFGRWPKSLDEMVAKCNGKEHHELAGHIAFKELSAQFLCQDTDAHCKLQFTGKFGPFTWSGRSTREYDAALSPEDFKRWSARHWFY